jgi:hypothetical protein
MFKVGDKVICFERDLADNNGQRGIVTKIISDKDWPVLVEFQGRFEWSYTEEGFRIDETQPFNRIEPATKLHKLLAGLE